MTTTDLSRILKLAQRAGLAHNNGAGGQYVLCATESQLIKFADSLAAPEAAEPVMRVRADGDACEVVIEQIYQPFNVGTYELYAASPTATQARQAGQDALDALAFEAIRLANLYCPIHIREVTGAIRALRGALSTAAATGEAK
jgi:hypothetical protein